MLQYISKLYLPTGVVLRSIIPSLCRIHSYTTDSKGYPTICTGANYLKEGTDPVLKHPSEYPDWLWTLGERAPDIKDMSPEVHGKRYYKRLRKIKLRENNMIRKQRKF